MFNYGIGGTDAKRDATEAFADIPPNRTLLIEHLTDSEPLKPEIVEELQNTAAVFKHYKPEKEVKFINQEGNTIAETLHFSAIEHFGIHSIASQSNFLQNLQRNRVQYENFARQIKSNKVLSNVLNDSTLRREYLNILSAMIQDIEDKK